MVERRHDPDDRRVWRLHLLPGAEPILEEITLARSEMMAHLLGDNVDPDAVAKTAATLRLMKLNLTADAS
jgi:DNA-binding MarR family transcriptional regulator